MDDQNDDFMAPFDLAGLVAATERMQQNNDQQRNQHDVYNSSEDPPMMSLHSGSSAQSNPDAFQTMMAMQGVEGYQQPQPANHTQSLLEQQLRLNQLQQLQQLQQQIFQQQVCENLFFA